MKAENISIVEYEALPKYEAIPHFQNISFLILDWKLTKKNADALAKDNIQFIEELNEKCFCPIFIFTNDTVRNIEVRLKDAKLMSEKAVDNILLLHKDEVKEPDMLFKRLSEWLEEHPSIYVLKEWEREYQQCRTKLFSDFSALNPEWPLIMWKNFTEDGGNPSLQMGELISSNLYSRMAPFKFKHLDKLESKEPVEQDALRKLLQGAKYLTKLNGEDIGTGDLFKIKDEANKDKNKDKYYLNIRAQCDLIGRDKSSKDDIELYCIEGTVTTKDLRKHYNKDGISVETVHFIDECQVIEFSFKDIRIKTWGELKEHRIGRLLPPFINRIQQRYALYMHRHGLPRIPDKAFRS